MLTHMGNETGGESSTLPDVEVAAPVEQPTSWWGRTPLWGRLAIIAAPIVVAVIVVVTVVSLNARPSLANVAGDCGGRLAGIHVDETGMLIDMSYGSDGLICVIGKVLPDKGDQYAVAIASDEGKSGSLTLDGREVTFGTLGDAPFVFIGDR